MSISTYYHLVAIIYDMNCHWFALKAKSKILLLSLGIQFVKYIFKTDFSSNLNNLNIFRLANSPIFVFSFNFRSIRFTKDHVLISLKSIAMIANNIIWIKAITFGCALTRFTSILIELMELTSALCIAHVHL